MTISRERIEFKESFPAPEIYGPYLSAQQNGKHALTFFWGLLRHHLERGHLDSHLGAAFRKLAQQTLRDGNGSTASTSGPIRVTFGFGDPGIKARCLSIAASHRISMADTVRLLLIASQLHETQTAQLHTTVSSSASR